MDYKNEHRFNTTAIAIMISYGHYKSGRWERGKVFHRIGDEDILLLRNSANYIPHCGVWGKKY